MFLFLFRCLVQSEQDHARIDKRMREENAQDGNSKKKSKRTTKGKKKSKTTTQEDAEEEMADDDIEDMLADEAAEEAEEEDPEEDEEEDDVPDEDEEEEEEDDAEAAEEEEEGVQGSAPVDVGSQGIETEQVVEALKKLINSAEFRNHADLQTGSGVRVALILSMMQSDYGMPGLNTQRLVEALNAFMEAVPDAIMMDQDRVLII